MRVVFVGTVSFSFQMLAKLVEVKAAVVGVVTKRKSNFNADFKDLSPLCHEHNIPIHYTTNINSDESMHWIQELRPDIIFCFGWSSLLKKDLLDLPSMGIVGFHPAALPQNRGRHPIVWALALGLTQSASTFFFMGEGADDGDILSQKTFDISYEDDAKTVYDRITRIAADQLAEFVPQLQNNTNMRIEQDHSAANTWRKRGAPDGQIDFRMSSRAIYNLVRALTRPYVGAHISYNGQSITVWSVREAECPQENIEPGKVLSVSPEGILVKCHDGAVKITEHTFSSLPATGDYL